jgi:hypothetical protein
LLLSLLLFIHSTNMSRCVPDDWAIGLTGTYLVHALLFFTGTQCPGWGV